MLAAFEDVRGLQADKLGGDIPWAQAWQKIASCAGSRQGVNTNSPSMILSPKSKSSRAMSHPSPVASGQDIRTSRSLSSWPPWYGLHAA